METLLWPLTKLPGSSGLARRPQWRWSRVLLRLHPARTSVPSLLPTALLRKVFRHLLFQTPPSVPVYRKWEVT